MRRMGTLLKRSMMPLPRCLMRLLGMRGLLVADMRYRITRKRGEHGQGEETSQRPEGLIHSVVPREPTGTNHEIARSVRLELPEGYHTADSQLSRLGNGAGKTWSTVELRRSTLTDLSRVILAPSRWST